MAVLYITIFIVLLDQITKFIVKGGTIPLLNIHVQGMDYGSSINVIGDFFKITFVENPGLAFGIDVNETSKLLLSIFTLIATIGIFYYLYKSRNEKLIVRISIALILGGAIGNLIDRTFYGVFYGYAPIFYGKVVDFLNFDFIDFTILGRTYERFPIFNIADSSVTIGVIMLILFHHSKEKEKVESELSNNTLVEIKNEIDTENVSIEKESNDENSNRKED
ncbi:MAG: signal peptidase II [Stygiobacter sp.]|uniref:Lipoprotein signal peptidase n=1 Tax=Stygiobacter electus TaxID=3032292 RepID=A0AAE3TCE4_9BACT|nr:signal peptidase II [Stygiobacter electus]MDF1611820.1 signal peptidase II [Stygiobacter electus]